MSEILKNGLIKVKNGRLQPLDPILQWGFRVLALPDAFLLTKTVLAAITLIDRFFDRKVSAGLSLPNLCHTKFPALGTGICVLLTIIRQVFPTTNTRLIFPCIPLLVTGRLHKQGQQRMPLAISVVFFTFILCSPYSISGTAKSCYDPASHYLLINTGN